MAGTLVVAEVDGVRGSGLAGTLVVAEVDGVRGSGLAGAARTASPLAAAEAAPPRAFARQAIIDPALPGSAFTRLVRADGMGGRQTRDVDAGRRCGTHAEA